MGQKSSLGFVGAGGVAALQAGLRQRLMDRMLADRQAQEMELKKHQLGLEMRGADRADRALDQQGEIANLMREQQATARATAAGEKFNESIPGGTVMQAEDPRLGSLRLGGASMSDKGIAPQAPPEALAADPDAAPPADLPGTIGNSPSPIAGRLVMKGASAAQQNTLADNAARDKANQQAAEDRATAGRDRADAADRAALDRKDAASLAQQHADNIRLTASLRPPAADKLVKVEHKDPDTGRTVIEWLPQSEVKGKTYQKGSGAAADAKLASAEAVNQTGDDIIAKLSDPKVAAMLGPMMGRYNKMQDWYGNPPPELAELAGAIESYSLASMGVHGMRSTVAADKIKAMLDKKHTPESLIAEIKGLNKFSQHFMENEGRGTSGAGPAKDTAKAPKRVVYDINGNPVK